MQLRSRFLNALQRPFVHGVMGLVMAAAGLAEAISPFVDEIQGNEATIGAEHGALIYGLYVLLRSIGEGITGVRDTREGIRYAATAAMTSRGGRSPSTS